MLLGAISGAAQFGPAVMRQAFVVTELPVVDTWLSPVVPVSLIGV